MNWYQKWFWIQFWVWLVASRVLTCLVEFKLNCTIINCRRSSLHAIILRSQMTWGSGALQLFVAQKTFPQSSVNIRQVRSWILAASLLQVFSTPLFVNYLWRAARVKNTTGWILDLTYISCGNQVTLKIHCSQHCAIFTLVIFLQILTASGYSIRVSSV